MSEREKQLLATMVYEAVRFSSWAVGEGITPIAGEPAKDPGEFLSDYVTGIDGDDYEGLAEVARDAIGVAPSALQPEWQPIKNAPRDRRIEVRYLTDDPRPVQWMATDHGVGWHLANGFGAVPIEFDPTEWRDMVARAAATTGEPADDGLADLITNKAAEIQARNPGIAQWSYRKPGDLSADLATLCDAVMADVKEAKRRLDADLPKDAPLHPVSAFLTGIAIHVGKARAALPPRATAMTAEAVGLATTLEHWVEALRSPTNFEHSVSDLAMLNGRCITDDLEEAVEALRATPPSSGNADAVREQSARIINPAIFEKFDAHAAAGDRAANGTLWAEVLCREEMDEALEKADAIAALSSAPVAGEWQEVKEIVDLFFAPWGAAKGARWEALSGDQPFNADVAMSLIEAAIVSRKGEAR